MALIDDYVLVKLTQESADLMCEVNKDLKKYMTKERGQNVLYLQLSKALYGCMQSALLWYQTFKGCLSELGFTINPYDPCVANKTINKKQCTVVWYVDDTKISHEDPKVVDWVIQKIEEKFGKMSVTRGKKHTFVGVDIEFHDNGTVSLSMLDYVKECIDLYRDKIKRMAVTPASGELFNQSKEKVAMLTEAEANKFHHTTAKLLYLSKRARIDIDLAVSFLCTRVSQPDITDEEKLIRVLSYLEATKDLTRVIGSDGLTYMHTWTDASLAIHRDMKGHTGGVISMGRGTVIHHCSKQKLNAKSSTETEVIGVSDVLPYTVWAMYFMREQGYTMARSVFHQDNNSAIRMITNGKASCSSRSRHIHIRYFFVKDIFERENIQVQHCPTDRMVADFYTKPVQGKQFKELRAIIMGHKRPSMEERVEN